MNYADMTVKELRELAAERGVKAAAPGNKAQLVIALEEADKAAEAPQEQETAPEGAEQEPKEAQEGAETSQEPEEAKEGAEPGQEPEEAKEAGEAAQEPETACYKTYVGPNIPGGLLTHGKILYGTEHSIREFLAPVLARYPKVANLIVPMEDTEKAMRDVKNPKKLLFHKAQELSAETKRNGG